MAARMMAMKRAQMKAKKDKEAAAVAAAGGWDGGGLGEGEPTPGGGEEDEADAKEGGDGDNHVDEEELWDWVRGLVKFLMFVLIFTILQVAFRPSASINEYTTLWKSVISASYDDVNFIEDLWTFLEEEVVKILRPDFFATSTGYWANDASQYVYGNRMLGPVRIRQIRVVSSECSPMQRLFLQYDDTLQKHCFLPYLEKIDEGKLGVAFTRANQEEPLIKLSCADQNCPDDDNGTITRCCTEYDHFHYQTYKQLGESSVDYPARFTSYPGGGYVIDLINGSHAEENIAMLRRHGWIDLKTRAVFVDFAFYNPNVDLFLVCRIVFELMPTGLVKPFSSYRVVRVQGGGFGFSEPTTRTQNGLLCAMIVLIAWLFWDEVSEIYKESREYKSLYKALKHHCSDFWNMMDIFTLILAFILLYLQFYQYSTVSKLIEDPNNLNPSQLQTLGFWAQQAQNIAGLQGMVLWLKVFKFAAVTHKLEKLFKALSRSIPAALDLLFVYFILIVAFSVSGHILFGHDVPLFESMMSSLLSSIRVALFGDYDWDSLYESNRTMGPIWVVLFMLASGIFLINFLVGIFCEVYAEVMSEEDDGKISILGAAITRFSDILQLKKLHAKIADIEAHLGDLDADHDGVVSKVELAEFLAKEGAYEVFDATEVTEVMTRFDKDGNGFLSPDEMLELRAVLQKRKRQLEDELRIEEGPESAQAAAGAPRGGVTPAQLQMELKQVREVVDHLQEKVDRSCNIEKKMLLVLESLTTKVDSLVSRENDFKFLRNSVGPDWIK